MKKLILIISFITIQNVIAAENYFQQWVNYQIDCRLNDTMRRIEGTQTLHYVNNSTDSLQNVYFHLYFNRFKKDALTNNIKLRERTTASIEINQLKIAGKETEDYSIDRTLMRVKLEKMLAPGDTVEFYFDFTSKLPPASSRFGYQGSHYDVGNWFPTPVVYDKDGWHLNQHIDNEFYQEWGNFEVNITVPKGFVLGATGDLQNPEEALQDTTQEVRDWYLHNIEDTIKTTTWRYIAENVHDFAWTADPEYKYYTQNWDGIDVHYLVMDHNYDDWKKEIEAGVGAVRIFSEKIGRYPYKQITIADTYIRAGGMEYPGIVFINTYSGPDESPNWFRAVVIHEIAHNWFYGLLGSNQTEYEWMDEGFTQFAEIIAMEEIYGVKNNYSPGKNDWFSRTFWFDRDDRQWTHLNALRLIKDGREKDPINTMPDRFGWGVGASQYDKMGSVLIMLENVMGKKKFWQGLQNYYNKWHFKHPQPADFKREMELVYGGDLYSFTNQWINSVRQLDYRVKSIDTEKSEAGYILNLELENLADINMPVDLLIILKNNDSLLYHIPIENFTPRIAERKYLKDWHFSEKFYSTAIPVLDDVDEVIIDPDNNLLDVNKLNNSSHWLPKQKFYFMKLQSFAGPLDKYMWEIWPSVFYNDIDKFKVGLANIGGYLNRDHLIDIKAWYKINTGNVDFTFKYEHPMRWLYRTKVFFDAYNVDGRQGSNLKVRFLENSNRFYFLTLSHYNLYDPIYLNYPWQTGIFNTINLNLNYYFDSARNNNSTYISINLKNSLEGSEQPFSLARLDFTHKIFSRYNDYSLEIKLKGGAASQLVPVQEAFNLAGANGVNEFENPFYRSRGSLPVNWRNKGYLYLNDYAQVRGVSLIDTYPQIGNNIVAASFDFNFPSLFDLAGLPYLYNLDNSLFFDTGAIWTNKMPKFEKFVKTAGFTISYSNFNILRRIIGIEEIKVDFPVWIGQNSNNKEDIGFRWLVSFNFNIDRSPIL